MISTSRDKTIKFWDLPNRKCIKSKDESSETILVSTYLPTNQVIITGSEESLINIWKIYLSPKNQFENIKIKISIP